MNKLLQKCKEVLAQRRSNDTNSIRRLVCQVAEHMNMKLSLHQIDRCVVYLKYGKEVW